MVEKTMEVFMDDFSAFGNSFETCLSRLDKMLQRCEDTKLCLNWEKSHFMVKEGIVLGHKISKNGIEVDKAKVDDKFHNVMKCLNIPSKFVKSLTFGALILWARSRLHEGTRIFSWLSIICPNGLKRKRSPQMTPESFANSSNRSSPDLVPLELSSVIAVPIFAMTSPSLHRISPTN
nr:reverse transcriptase domain-containing protein [Tanacetum cinerariifolium]